MKYDVIIIGAGLGGLTAGAKLAKEGKKVLVIEQHSQPGGCATTFKRGDFTFEVGLHEMDGPSARDMKTRVFNDLDVFNNVEFIKVPEFYRFINGRYSVTIPHEPDIAIERLGALFPSEKDGITAYFNHLLNPTRNTGNKDGNVADFLDSIIRNEDLKLILLGNMGYFHDDPSTLSLAYYTMAQRSYYTGSASFIRGGSQKLSDHLAGFIKKNGGDIQYNHLVTRILTHDGRATGVNYKKKRNSAEDEKTAEADIIIANNAIPNVADMLPGDPGSTLRNEMTGLRPGASLLTIYLGFSRPPSEIGNNYYSTAVFDSSVKSIRDIYKNNNDDFTKRSFIFVDYGQIDSGLAPAGKSVGAICCIDYLKDWITLDKKEYKTKKKQVNEMLIDRLDRLISGIKDIIEYAETGTASTVNRYTLNPEGAVYGFAQTPSRKLIDSFEPLQNLYFASAWGKTGGGFSGAILGAYLTAFNILRKERQG